MNLTVALYVEERKRPGQPVPEYAVRPLFARRPIRRDELLSRAISKLAGELRGMLDALGRDMRHDALARWSFLPDLSERRLTLRLELRRTAPVCKALFVTFDWRGRRLAFTPVLPDLWFETEKGESLESRAAEVLGAHFRRLEKEAGGEDVIPSELTDPPRAWVTTVELDVQLKQQPSKPPSRFLLLGGGGEEMSGQAEIEKVGRCLDWLYPDELDRVVLRDAEVGELTRLLADVDKRPVLLVGPRQAGKTAVVHEHVFRKVDQRRQPFARKQNVWLLSPQRLISGMSYVGQWEQRLLAILAEARKREHVLYFDDLLGLFQAGLTRDSDLSVAHVLRPYVERREVRVLAQATPEALRVLRERDRTLADLFHILPIREPAEAPNLRILIETVRQLEGRFRCTFAPDVLPTVVELLRRYGRDAAMPGKAAALLRRLAGKYAGGAFHRDTALREFNAQSGLAVAFLDAAQRLQRGEVLEAIGRELIGQRPAVEAMADTVLVAKARLNDAGRPLASFLFLGPTGVGKTQAAKALAAYLYGNAERLVRFDMNEYVDATGPARLIGTFARPEGLLTAAVRRQPFCVLLLDEIEKAHPAVFDLLLQVLGEGRLTDALGRTADFTGAIVVLTSNLGVREGGAAFGLKPGAVDRGAAFVAAAERFFRPEFFNRLDHVIPFQALSRQDVAGIALKLIRNVFDRDGLRQRKCVLRVDGPAVERVADQGFHPELGARALRRAIERQLTRPVALAMASIPPTTPTVITLYARGDGFLVHTHALAGVNGAPPTRPDVPQRCGGCGAAAPDCTCNPEGPGRDEARFPLSSFAAPDRSALDLSDPEWTLERTHEATHRIEAAAAASADAAQGTVLTQGQIGPEHYRYFALRELAERVRRTIQGIFDRLDAPKRPMRGGAARATPRSPAWVTSVRYLDSPDHALWREFAAAEDVNQYLTGLYDAAAPLDAGLEEQARRIVQEVALLDVMAAGGPALDRALIHVRPAAGGGGRPLVTLFECYREAFNGWNGGACDPPQDPPQNGPFLLVLDMSNALTLARLEEGTHLFASEAGVIEPIQVRVLPIPPGQSPLDVFAEDQAAHDRWREEMAAGRATPEDDPWRIGPVLRVYDASSGVLDLRSGMINKGGTPSAADLRAFILSQLAPPAEVLA